MTKKLHPTFHILRPPVLALVYILAAFIFDRFIDLPPVIPKPFHWVGLLPILCGFWIVVSSLRIFRQKKTTYLPHGEPTFLVLEGPYRWTRNPIYIGLSLVLLGIAFLTGRMVYFFVPLLFFLSINYIFIPVEEATLERIFGEAYQAYKKKVKKWF